MFYYLFKFLEEFNVPGAQVFSFITFRAGLTFIVSLAITILFGKSVIHFLQKQQIGEIIRDLGLEGQMQKKGTPTMGGILIIGGILIPVFLFAQLHNIYIILMIVTTIWLGLLGFADDYIKVFKKNKEGLKGKYKIIGQIILGLIVGVTLHYNSDVVIVENVVSRKTVVPMEMASDNEIISLNIREIKSTKTTIPFLKNNEFDYAYFIWFLGDAAKEWAWLVFVVFVIIITTAVSNGANMTDGLDGLATGVSAIIGAALGVFAYLSGHIVYADYLNIMFIPYSGELVVFAAGLLGATIGFLWYNTYPAQIFMGDTGSLSLGGIIAVMAILIRKELLIPVLCGIFLVENLSVMVQVGYFKYTKRKYGVGKRILKMAPLHHHFQKSGMHETKIVARFWIVGLILAAITIITLKLR